MAENLQTFLRQQVANFSILTNKLMHCHFYAHGPGFFTIHNELREEFHYSFQKVDDLAERLLMIDGMEADIPTTLKEQLELSTLGENQKELKDVPAMVEAILADYTRLINELKSGIALAEEQDDPVTEDLFIGIIGYLEERKWQFEAYLF